MMTAPEPDGIVRQTSSYSNGGAACVEVGWWKSSYSAGEGNSVEVGCHTSSHSGTNGGCVEVAPALDRVLVRDSRSPDGPFLTVPAPAWRAFRHIVTH